MLAKGFGHTDAEKFLQRVDSARVETLPTRWVNMPAHVEVDATGTVLKCSSTDIPPTAISTDKPLRGDLKSYYFEVTSKKMDGVEQATYPERPHTQSLPSASVRWEPQLEVFLAGNRVSTLPMRARRHTIPTMAHSKLVAVRLKSVMNYDASRVIRLAVALIWRRIRCGSRRMARRLRWTSSRMCEGDCFRSSGSTL